jgi:rod shape determining protein RodA
MLASMRAESPSRFFATIDWYVVVSAVAISLLGLVTIRPLSLDEHTFFDRQVIWIVLALIVFFVTSLPSYSFLRRTPIVTALYGIIVALLSLIFIIGTVVKGAQQRFDLGFFALQPSDPAKLILIIVLAKYFARRHVEISHVRHILVSGLYAFFICALVFLQPDFGGAIITASIWLGMVLVSGISWKHLAALLATGIILAGALWTVVLEPYQKARIISFVHPLADIQGAGYNAYQSTVAVGSGELTGKGIGFGTQSKLKFLPEYHTDFIFAAYAEEWGFVGVVILLGLFAILLVRTLIIAAHGSDNFTTLYCLGVAIFFLSHLVVHVGMNLGLLPVTGTTIPFMSYGGSHLITEFAALGIMMGLRRRTRAVRTAPDVVYTGA